MTLADTIANAIGAKRAGGWWRTSTAICHGGDTADGLSFRSPDDDPDTLIVYCFSRGCHDSAEGRNRARDNLRRAAGLPPWEARAPSHGGITGDAQRRRTERKGRSGISGLKVAHRSARESSGGDTAAYAARLWAAAAVSTGRAPEHHPVSRWLAGKAEGGLWPPGVLLPEGVRWLPRRKMPAGRGVRPDSRAAGALVMAMPRLDAPLADPRKVHLVAIDSEGRKAQHWTGGGGDKRTFGADASAYGLLWRIRPGTGGVYHLHVCEGLADGLRILRYADDPAIAAVCAGTGYGRIEAGWFAAVTLWPDADEAGMRAAQQAAQKWADQGYDVQIKQLAAGHDPASAPLKENTEDGQAG